MFAWLRNLGRADYVLAPRELPPAGVAEQEMLVDRYDMAAHIAHLGGDLELMDRLLDERLRVREPRPGPPVRAIPGRTP
jgi:hypothetical protein